MSVLWVRMRSGSRFAEGLAIVFGILVIQQFNTPVITCGDPDHDRLLPDL